MVKSYSNLDPEKVLEAVRKHFATTSDEEVVRRYRLHLSRYVNPVKGPLAKSTQNYFLIVIALLI